MRSLTLLPPRARNLRLLPRENNGRRENTDALDSMLAEHGFETVTSGLLADYDTYRQVLKRHGIEVHTEFVQRELLAMQRSGNDPNVVRTVIEAPQEGMPDLASAIDRLEHSLQRLNKTIA